MTTKILQLFVIIALITGGNAFGQSQLIIDENFQGWDGTPDEDPQDCESGLIHETELVRTLTLVTSDGGKDIDVDMIKCGIAPDCGSKRKNRDGGENGDGVTDGFVSLSKAETDVDTIGEFVFGPVPQIDSIQFGHSATGDDRGIRIYKSTDGETWERATDDEFNISEDSQAGDLRSVEIKEENVYIKFTSGLDSDGITSQFSRLHNIAVYGEPGELAVGINGAHQNSIQVRALGNGKFSTEGNYQQVTVYDAAGKIVHADINNTTNIIDLNNVSDGIYIIRAEDKTGVVFTGKILKQ